MRTRWLVVLVLAALCGQCKEKSRGKTAAQESAAAAAAAAERVVLVVGDVSRTNRDFADFIRLQYSDVLDTRDNGKVRSRLFDLFCEQQIILFQANREGVVVDDDEVDAYLADARRRRQGQDPDREMVRNSLKAQKLLLASAYGGVEVTDREIAQYYQAHQGEYRKTEAIELHQIMMAEREKLLQVRSELLRQPARFAEMARSQSQAADAGEGGAMGVFERGMLPQEMEEMVFSLKVGEISPIVESPYGFHLFKVTRRQGARVQALAAVREEINSKLQSAKLAAAYEEYLGRLRGQVPLQARYENLDFPYVKSNPGANENESNPLPGRDPVPGA